jgi:hypothetical protein
MLHFVRKIMVDVLVIFNFIGTKKEIIILKFKIIFIKRKIQTVNVINQIHFVMYMILLQHTNQFWINN